MLMFVEGTETLSAVPEGEGQPAHVGGHAALPEVHHTLEVLLGKVLLLLLPLLSVLGELRGHPVPTQEHVAVLVVKYPYNHRATGLKLNTQSFFF